MGKEEKLEMINVKNGHSIYLDPNMKMSDFIKNKKVLKFLKDYTCHSHIIIRQDKR